MTSFDPRAYGPEFAPLLDVDRRRALDGGVPVRSARAALERISIRTAFDHADRVAVDRDMAACCLAGAWLLYDYLDNSHTISQSIKTHTGSFWHGIMHRREGDFSNAAYWFHHVGRHPVFDALAERAAELAAARGNPADAQPLWAGSEWDPFAFVDLTQAVQRGRSDARELCLDIQQAEWELLFDHCYQAAVNE